MAARRWLAVLSVTACVLWASPASAATGAVAHGWFSGPGEVWAGMYKVELKLHYQALPGDIPQPAQLYLGEVAFEVRDPSGNPTTGIAVTYNYFLEERPAPLPSFGVLDNDDQHEVRSIWVGAASGTPPGTYRIRPHVRGFYWYANGSYLNPDQWTATLGQVNDWYSFTVHAVTTTTAPGVATRRPPGAAPPAQAAPPATGTALTPGGAQPTEPASPGTSPASARSSASLPRAGREAPAGLVSYLWLTPAVALLTAGVGLTAVWWRRKRRG